MATLAELIEERDDLRAELKRIRGTTAASGSQSYTVSGRTMNRVEFKKLQDRLDWVELAISRMGGASGDEGAGLGRNVLVGKPG
jgi:hypothetical protein